MADNEPVDAPEVKETPQEAPKEAKAPVLDSSRPLASQVDKILKQLPEEEKKEESKDVEPKEDKQEEEPASSEEAKETEDAKDEVAEEADDFEDEGEEEPEPVELAPWQEYVLGNLPEIQVRGHVGEGKDRVFRVKRAEDLPDGFDFEDKRAELGFNAAIASQEMNARELLQKWNMQDAQNKYIEQQQQDAIDVQSDIQSLQREGILPKFKYEPTDPKFNSDPAVKEANEIYALYEKTNQRYVEEFSKTGRSYKISYRDAADKFYAAKARAERQAPPKKEEVKQNPERERTASRTGSPQTADPSKERPVLRPGITPRDVYQMYKRGAL